MKTIVHSLNFMQIFELVFGITLLGLVSLAGVVSNLINMVIFVKLELKDSMSVGLFALSLTDFGTAALELAISLSTLTAVCFPVGTVDLWSLSYIAFGWAMCAGYLISCWITTILSVEKCLCVVSPFRVRQIFTRARCVCLIIAVYLIHIISFAMIYNYEHMGWVNVDLVSDNSNQSATGTLMFTVVFSDVSGYVEIIVDIFTGLFLSIGAQVLLIVCTIWMAYALKISSKIRSKITDVTSEQRKSTQLSIKEKKLIKVALFLAVLLTACNLPRIAITLFYHTYPNLGGSRDLITALWTVSSFFSTVCCASNAWGYFFLNSSYKRMLYKIMGCDRRLSFEQIKHK
ncbi:hypothetical protein Btru_020916 [Bulinus truncatus]|nr:hypothetical protein Btru_020916 [Bulinus truncatus]